MTTQERPPRGYVCLHWREGDAAGCCKRCLSELEEEPIMNEPEPENPPASEATLRDIFAAKAMQGMCAAPDNFNHEDIPAAAYDIADQMLAARQKGAQP